MKKILVVGSLNMDFVIEVPKMPAKGETLLGKTLTLVPGGKGANQAYAVGKLGGEVSILGAVGNDEYGRKILDNLNSVNVHTEHVKIFDQSPTGCAFVTVDQNGDNNIIVISGANGQITEETICHHIHLIDEADIIVLQLEIPLDVVSFIAENAHHKGKLVILDPAPAIPNISTKLLNNVDILKPNETELQILTGKPVHSKADLLDAVNILLNNGVKNVIVTLGENGSLWGTRDHIQHFPAFPVKAVDTTAAGDSFTAALAVSLLGGNNMEEAIKMAHIVSSIVVTKKGAQTSIPDQSEINVFLNKLEK